MKGRSRSRPAPTIGQRVVVRLVPIPENIRPIREQYLGGLIRRCLTQKAGAA